MPVAPHDRILLPVAESSGPEGASAMRNDLLCLRRGGLSMLYGEQAERSREADWGAYVHALAAQWYARLREAQHDRDPDLYFAPREALDLIQQHNPAWSELAPSVWLAFERYLDHWRVDDASWEVLHVEEVFACTLDAGPLGSYRRTGRLDLVVRPRTSQEVIIVDLKSMGSVTPSRRVGFSRDVQFLLHPWIAAQNWPALRFGGSLINMMDRGGSRFERVYPEPSPGLVRDLPLTVAWQQIQRRALRDLGIPPERWPPSPTDKTCLNRFGRCPWQKVCDAGSALALQKEEDGGPIGIAEESRVRHLTPGTAPR